ncbi:MAG: DUF2784 domain-containing protein [Myxococcales bacterium]|nr:DUF2784 domain-containing protein [Myxococcales bacterium]
MIHRVLADLVVVLHLAFIVFVLLGGLLTLLWRWAPLVHLPAASWGVLVEVTGRVCPLTPLENSLRHAAGASGYAGSFVDHYVVPIIYPGDLSPPVQLFLASMVVLTNALVYATVRRRMRRAA